MSDIITDVTKYEKGWHGGLPETECGYGSKVSATVIQRKVIPEWVAKYGIKSVADIGAGDLNWIKLINVGCPYKPYDLVPRHPEVKRFDLLKDRMPQADCYMVLWVLNHFPEKQAEHAINKLTRTKARWLITTWDTRLWPFLDLPVTEEIQIRGPSKPGRPNGHTGIMLRLHDIS